MSRQLARRVEDFPCMFSQLCDTCTHLQTHIYISILAFSFSFQQSIQFFTMMWLAYLVTITNTTKGDRSAM